MNIVLGIIFCIGFLTVVIMAITYCIKTIIKIEKHWFNLKKPNPTKWPEPPPFKPHGLKPTKQQNRRIPLHKRIKY